MSSGPRPHGRDVFLPVFLILIGVVALLVNASAEEWDLWEILLLAVPVFVLSAGINLAVESRRMATAVVVAAAGAALLARQVGLVEWPVWQVLVRAWPLVLVAFGLDLALGRASYVRLGIATVIGAGIVLAGVWVSRGALQPEGQGPSRAVAYSLDGASAAAVTIEPAIGTVLLNPAAEPASLIEGTITPDPGDGLVVALDEVNGSIRLSLSRSDAVVWRWPAVVPASPEWDLALTTGVPVDLVVDLGVGRCRVDLTGVQARSLEVSVGVGECVVTLPSHFNLDARITGGVGRTEVIIPADLEARVLVDTGIATATIVGDLAEVGEDDDRDEYVTPGYDSATERTTIEAEQGIGALVIRRQ